MPKRPWFPFYPSDWTGSPTVRGMSNAERGVYIHLLAVAWQSEQPGTLPGSHEEIAKISGIQVRTIRRFFAKHPQIFCKSFTKVSQNFFNPKLVKLNEMNATIGNKIASSITTTITRKVGSNSYGGQTRADRSRANIQEAARKLGIPCPDLDAPFQLAVPKGTNQR